MAKRRDSTAFTVAVYGADAKLKTQGFVSFFALLVATVSQPVSLVLCFYYVFVVPFRICFLENLDFSSNFVTAIVVDYAVDLVSAEVNSMPKLTRA